MWDERQRRMLEWMGHRVWFPDPVPQGGTGRSPSAFPLRQGEGAAAAEHMHTRQPPDAETDAAGDVGVTAAAPAVVDAAASGSAPSRRQPGVHGGAQMPVSAPRAGPAGLTAGRAESGNAAVGAVAAAHVGAVSSMDWAQLRAAVAGCRACRLCETRTQTVFGVGNEQAHWMVVGEAPGEQEDLQGEPFVGAAGKLLDAMLRALGLTRAPGAGERQVFIANTLKCRPPRNRNPAPDELQRCEPFLVRQIELVQPRLVLAMGRFAVQTLLRTDEPVGRLRGRVHEYHGVPVVVTYHPAYLLRNPVDKARAWDDLCLAAAVAEAAG